MDRYQISACHKTLREQWANGGYVGAVSEEEALNSLFYKSALPWFEEGYASIAATDAKTPAIWSWAHWGTGGFDCFSHADLVFMARMFPNRASLTLLGSPVDPARRLVGVDIDSGDATLLAWDIERHGPALAVRSGRVGGGTHHYRRIGDDGHAPHDGQPGVNGKLGPDHAWAWTTHNKKGQPLPRAYWKSCIDVKSNGGYLVAPGSLHKSGTVYGVVGCEAGPITREQIRAIPALQAPITFRSGPTTDAASKTFGGLSGSHYEHIAADFGEAHWSHLDATWAALKPGQHRAVACHLHDHSDPNGKPGTVYVHADGRKGYNCNGRGESYAELVEVVPAAKARVRMAVVRSPEEALEYEAFCARTRYLSILTEPVTTQDADLEAAERWILEQVFEEPSTLGVLAEVVTGSSNRLKPPNADDQEVEAATEQYSSACAHLGYCYGAGVSKVTPGKLTRLPCKRYTCGVCGPRQMAAERAAARVVFNRAGYRDWNVAIADVTNENRGSVMKHLERWPGLYESISTNPETGRVILLWAPGTTPPPFPHSVKTDASDEFDDAMTAVDLMAWENHVGRVRIVKGRRELATAIHTLRDQVLGIKPATTEEGRAHKMKTAHSLTFLPKKKVEEYMANYLGDPEFKYSRLPHPPSDLPQAADRFASKTKATLAEEEEAIKAGRRSGALPDLRDRRKEADVDYSEVETFGFDAPVATGRRQA